MRALLRTGSAKCIDYAALAIRIPVLNPIPMNSVRPRRDVVQLGIANQGPKFFLVKINFLLRLCVLFR